MTLKIHPDSKTGVYSRKEAELRLPNPAYYWDCNGKIFRLFKRELGRDLTADTYRVIESNGGYFFTFVETKVYK